MEKILKYAYPDNKVYFNPNQVYLNVELLNVGKTNYKKTKQHTTWAVKEIMSKFAGNSVGSYFDRKVEVVRRTSDRVTLIGPNGKKRVYTFIYLATSSVWRLK